MMQSSNQGSKANSYARCFTKSAPRSAFMSDEVVVSTAGSRHRNHNERIRATPMNFELREQNVNEHFETLNNSEGP